MPDSLDAIEFYRTARGRMAARLVRDRLALVWPDLTDLAVLGVGYTNPYLRLWREQAARCISALPDDSGALRWPPFGRNLACAVESAAFPFPDLFFDRILLVHGLEAAGDARGMLREAWRVLKDDGRLLVVAPNRRGMWAHVEATPFGQGQPYSSGQIARLLATRLFRVERQDTALFVPPSTWRALLRGASLWERVGRSVAPGFAGVTITEAVKDAYAVLPLQPAPRRRLVAAPAAGTAAFNLGSHALSDGDGRRTRRPAAAA